MLSNELIQRAARLSSATLHEASGKTGALPSVIKPLSATMKLCGRALPVQAPPGDNLWLHWAIYAAQPGDVLVVDVSGASEFGYWGEVMAVAAQARQLGGLVIAGGVRDKLRLIERGFAVCAATTCIRGTRKDPRGEGQIGAPILIGKVTVHKGDLVLGDADGVMVVSVQSAEKCIVSSEQRDADEVAIFERLRAGETTLDIYNLPQRSVR